MPTLIPDPLPRARALVRSHIDRLTAALPYLGETGDGILARRKIARLTAALPTITRFDAGMWLGSMGPNGLGPWVDGVVLQAERTARAAAHYGAMAAELRRAA